MTRERPERGPYRVAFRPRFSPKGWDNLAQGNALGGDAEKECSPKGCDTPGDENCPSPSGWNANADPTQGVALG